MALFIDVPAEMIIPIISAGCSVPLMMILRVSGRIIEAGIIDKIVRVFFICSVQAVKNMKIIKIVAVTSKTNLLLASFNSFSSLEM